MAERETRAAREQMRQRWESLRLELKTKLQLMQKTLEQDHRQPVRANTSYREKVLERRSERVWQVYSRSARVSEAGPVFKEDAEADNSSLKTLYDGFRQTVEHMTTQVWFKLT